MSSFFGEAATDSEDSQFFSSLLAANDPPHESSALPASTWEAAAPLVDQQPAENEPTIVDSSHQEITDQQSQYPQTQNQAPTQTSTEARPQSSTHALSQTSISTRAHQPVPAAPIFSPFSTTSNPAPNQTPLTSPFLTTGAGSNTSTTSTTSSSPLSSSFSASHVSSRRAPPALPAVPVFQPPSGNNSAAFPTQNTMSSSVPLSGSASDRGSVPKRAAAPPISAIPIFKPTVPSKKTAPAHAPPSLASPFPNTLDNSSPTPDPPSTGTLSGTGVNKPRPAARTLPSVAPPIFRRDSVEAAGPQETAIIPPVARSRPLPPGPPPVTVPTFVASNDHGSIGEQSESEVEIVSGSRAAKKSESSGPPPEGAQLPTKIGATGGNPFLKARARTLPPPVPAFVPPLNNAGPAATPQPSISTSSLDSQDKTAHTLASTSASLSKNPSFPDFAEMPRHLPHTRTSSLSSTPPFSPHNATTNSYAPLTPLFDVASKPGTRNINGRAVCPFVCFGFGGRVVSWVPASGYNSDHIHGVPPLRVGGLAQLLAQGEEGNEIVEDAKTFPGPLTSSSNQEQVKKYAQNKAQNCGWEQGILWQLLSSMVDHQGTVDIPSVKKLLLALPRANATGDNTLTTSNSTNSITSMNSTSGVEQLGLVEEQVLAGDLSAAYKVAADNHNWAHALLLAAALDSETFQNAVFQFAGTLPTASPLQTLYLLQASKFSELLRDTSKNCEHIKHLLENWQEQLSVMLAAKNISRPVISEFGDKLWTMQRRVDAAHFCYLLAEKEPSTVDDPHARIVLVGGDHRCHPHSFAGLTAIQRTEIWEFSKMLGNSQFTSQKILLYKFIHAQYLADLGMLDKAKQYLNVLSPCISRHKSQLPPLLPYLFSQFEARLSGSHSQSTSWLGGFFGFWSKSEPNPPALPKARTMPAPMNFNPATSHPHRGSTPSIPMPSNPVPFNPAPNPVPFNPVHPVPSNPVPFNPVPSNPVPFNPVPSNPVPSNPVPSNPVPSNPVPSNPVPSNPAPSNPKPAPSSLAPANSAKSASGGWGFFGKIGGVLSGWGARGTNANLGEENQFLYSKEYKLWYKKDQDPAQLAALRAASPIPPPSGGFYGAAPSLPSSPSGVGLTRTPPPHGRPKRFDILNPSATTGSKPSTPTSSRGTASPAPFTPPAAMFVPQATGPSTFRDIFADDETQPDANETGETQESESGEGKNASVASSSEEAKPPETNTEPLAVALPTTGNFSQFQMPTTFKPTIPLPQLKRGSQPRPVPPPAVFIPTPSPVVETEFSLTSDLPMNVPENNQPSAFPVEQEEQEGNEAQQHQSLSTTPQGDNPQINQQLLENLIEQEQQQEQEQKIDQIEKQEQEIDQIEKQEQQQEQQEQKIDQIEKQEQKIDQIEKQEQGERSELSGFETQIDEPEQQPTQFGEQGATDNQEQQELGWENQIDEEPKHEIIEDPEMNQQNKDQNSPPTSISPPPISTSPPPTSTNPPPTSNSPPPTSANPPPTSTNPPPISTSPPPTSTSPPPISASPPPTSTSPPPISTSPPPTSTPPLISAGPPPSGSGNPFAKPTSSANPFAKPQGRPARAAFPYAQVVPAQTPQQPSNSGQETESKPPISADEFFN